MDELITSLITDAPTAAIAIYLIWCWQTWGKEQLALLREIKSMLEHTREERRLSEAAQAQSAVPLGRKSR